MEMETTEFWVQQIAALFQACDCHRHQIFFFFSLSEHLIYWLVLGGKENFNNYNKKKSFQNTLPTLDLSLTVTDTHLYSQQSDVAPIENKHRDKTVTSLLSGGWHKEYIFLNVYLKLHSLSSAIIWFPREIKTSF